MDEHTDSRGAFELMHHAVPGEPGRDHIEEMAEAFIIEFKRMRWTDEMILKVFRDPFYAGPHYVYKARGEEFVEELLRNLKSQAPSSKEIPSSKLQADSDGISNFES